MFVILMQHLIYFESQTRLECRSDDIGDSLVAHSCAVRGTDRLIRDFLKRISDMNGLIIVRMKTNKFTLLSSG